jgi:sugar lactone lactonase YvrE
MKFKLLFLMAVITAADNSEGETRSNARPLSYRTSWIGNTFGGGPKWIQNAAESMQVLPDGTLLVGSFWDEAGREVGLYKDGDVVGQLPDTHMRAGFAVAASERYFFYAHTCAVENQPQANAGEALRQKPMCHFGVSRYTRDGQHAAFSSGKTPFKNMLSFREAPDNHSLIPMGLASSTTVLAVADTAFDSVKIIDPETMRLIREFSVPQPGRVVIDPAGTLWLICDGGKRVASYTPDGTVEIEALPLPAGALPNGLGFDREGRLLVCDNGPLQQVHVFDVARQPSRLFESLGEPGGMFGGPEPGKVGPWRLAGPTGAGADAAGNLYVSCNVPRGGTVLRAFSPRRELRWELLGLEFVDVADADPGSNGRDVFTADERYRFDPDGEAGTNWRWEAHTLDPPLPARFKTAFPGLTMRHVGARAGGEAFPLPARHVAGIAGHLPH